MIHPSNAQAMHRGSRTMTARDVARHGLWRWFVGLALLLTLLKGHAQTLDSISVDVQGNDVVARILFDARVRFMQQSPLQASELYRITFDLTAADDAVVKQTTEESKRVAATGAMPEFTLTYSPTPGRPIKTLTLQLREAAAVEVRQGSSPKVIELVFVGLAAKSSAPSPAPAKSATGVADKRYIVTLQSVRETEVNQLLPQNVRYGSYDLFRTNKVVDGVAWVELNAGYFATQEEAEAVRRDALARFPQAIVVELAAQPGPDGAVPVATPEVEKRATELITRARESLAARRTEAAIDDLNQLLLLPPNRYSQEAQELVGVAWERVGNTRRARTEYELYLKLYPQGEGAQRVGQRLASLEGAPATPGELAKTPVEVGTPPADRIGSRFAGNIAQYYYGGQARSHSLVNIASGIDQSTLSRTTESALVTALDVGARFSTAEAETRAVVRGSGTVNLSSSSNASSLLNAAYVDYRRNESGLAIRAGRQTPVSGGLLGIFDGVSVTVPFAQGWKVDLMGGTPANPMLSAPSQRLLAGMVEADNILGHWGGDVYLIDQTTEGIGNRRALGMEARYSDEALSIYSLLDYDMLFRKINAVTLQGSFQAPGQNTITVLLDSRKAPSLEMTNALISTGAASLKDLLRTRSMSEVRDMALLTTAEAKQALFSVSRPLSQNWQAAVDLRYSEIGALPSVGDFEATPATGGQYGATLQVTGSNLYSARDINNFNLSFLSTPYFKGTQVSYNNLTGLLNNDLTIEPTLRFYTQRDNQGVKLARTSPGLRGSYRLSVHGSLLAETLLEHSTTTGHSNNGTINSMFIYIGYRYELY
jgi:tetratricopeptide (TPR) repeat protein